MIKDALTPRIALALMVVMLGCQSQPRAGEEAEAASVPAPKPVVALETNRGLIRIELEPDLAPRTVRNFLLHVRSKFYDDMLFYRVKAGFMIQTGQLTSRMQKRVSPTPPILNEAENGLKNVRGAVAMARAGYPHSATSEFFINLVDNVALDFAEATEVGWGYAVFGHVIEGMDVVDGIAAVPVRPVRAHDSVYEAVPDEQMIIHRAYVEDAPANQ